jgi:hypothetical protein
MIKIQATVTTRVNVPRTELFDWFIPIELPRILLRYGPIPAIISTSGQNGPWDVVGNSRKVHTADGNTAVETVTAYERPGYFAYRVSQFSNFLGPLTMDAGGQWWFTDGPRQTTDVRWTYTFNARNPLAASALVPIVKVVWRGFMRQALDKVGELAGIEAPGFRAGAGGEG